MIRTRQATPEDDLFVRELFATSRGEVFDLLPAEQREVIIDLQLRARNESYSKRFPEAEHLIVEEDGHAVASMIVNDGRELCLLDIAVLPIRRGRGLGEQLLQALQERARAAGKAVVLQVRLDNPARRLYERLGFVEDARTETDVEMRWMPDQAKGKG